MTRGNSNCYDACDGEECSSGPHLHFELRDEKGNILNPLTNGINQPDRLAPIVEEIGLTPLNKDNTRL